VSLLPTFSSLVLESIIKLTEGSMSPPPLILESKVVRTDGPISPS
jgi:hypothetical protein